MSWSVDDDDDDGGLLAFMCFKLETEGFGVVSFVLILICGFE